MTESDELLNRDEGVPPADSAAGRPLSRRGVIAGSVGGLAALGLAGLVGYELPHTPKPQTITNSQFHQFTEVRTFLTRPDLRPPSVTFTTFFTNESRYFDAAHPRFIFLTPRSISQLLHNLGANLVPSQIVSAPSQPGLMILDRLGKLVYFKPMLTDNPFDFNMQADMGQPRLTWWHGQILVGHGNGVGEVADGTYTTIDSVKAGNGLMTDCHELSLTGHGTALISAYQETTTDLSILGGATKAKVWAGHVQEIDLTTGQIVFDWNSLDHVGVEESYTGRPSSKDVAYDYFHINSVKETPDGNLIVCARNTWALYKVNRATGKVMWRFNGKKSDFVMGPGTKFFWQHDARMPDANTITLFDDGGWPTEEKQARGLVILVDTKKMSATLKRAYVHPAAFISATQGSMELMPDGRVLVGWGNQGYFTEFAPDGAMVFDGQFPPRVCSYRAFTHDWIGTPTDLPAVLVRPNSSGGSVVYVSWNGATEVTQWQVLAGKSATTLKVIGSQEWTGFETAIAVSATGPYFRVVAKDKNGAELSLSEVARLNEKTIA